MAIEIRRTGKCDRCVYCQIDTNVSYGSSNLIYRNPEDIHKRMMRKLLETGVYRPWHDYKVEIEDCYIRNATILRFIQQGDRDDKHSIEWALAWDLPGKEIDQEIDRAIDKFVEFLHAEYSPRFGDVKYEHDTYPIGKVTSKDIEEDYFKFYVKPTKEAYDTIMGPNNTCAAQAFFYGLNWGCREVPEIDRVIFNNPATIVFWKDGTKTVVKKQKGDRYSKEAGLALCYMKKVLGNKGNFNNQFRKWCGEEK